MDTKLELGRPGSKLAADGDNLSEQAIASAPPAPEPQEQPLPSPAPSVIVAAAAALMHDVLSTLADMVLPAPTTRELRYGPGS